MTNQEHDGKVSVAELLSPCLDHPFRERVREAWQAFEKGDSELRAAWDWSGDAERAEKICRELMAPALGDAAFELRKEGERWQLFLSAGGEEDMVFPLEYFKESAPEAVKARWDIFIEDVPDYTDAVSFCEEFRGYEVEPAEGDEKDLRDDIAVGMTRALNLIKDFKEGSTASSESYLKKGIAPGYFFYPLRVEKGSDPAAAILDFRETAADQLVSAAGPDTFVYVGGATGTRFGYLDVLAWDVDALLTAAVGVFRSSGIPWAGFNVFRRDGKGILLFDQSKEKVHG